MSSQPGRSYADAINSLNSLQSNAAVIESIRQSGGKGGDQQLLETVEYLARIGYKVGRWAVLLAHLAADMWHSFSQMI